MTTTETPTSTPPETPPPTPAGETAEAWKAKYEETLKEARKHEDRAKANATAAKELEALKAKSMTDMEKAVDDARKEGRAEATREFGGRLAEASIRVAASTRMTPAQLDGLLEGIDASKFLDQSGDPDTKAITAWVDKVAPESDPGHRKPNVVPREGTASPKPGDDPVRALVRGLFNPGDE